MTSGRHHEGSEDGKCPHCGGNMLDHRHKLTASIVTGLIGLVEAGGGPEHLASLITNRNVIDNFQKLRYWGFVEQSSHANGSREGLDGFWNATARGVAFVNNKLRVYSRVWTYRGERIEWDLGSAKVRIEDLMPGYLKREDYAEAARVHQASGA